MLALTIALQFPCICIWQRPLQQLADRIQPPVPCPPRTPPYDTVSSICGCLQVSQLTQHTDMLFFPCSSRWEEDVKLKYLCVTLFSVCVFSLYGVANFTFLCRNLATNRITSLDSILPPAQILSLYGHAQLSHVQWCFTRSLAPANLAVCTSLCVSIPHSHRNVSGNKLERLVVNGTTFSKLTALYVMHFDALPAEHSANVAFFAHFVLLLLG